MMIRFRWGFFVEDTKSSIRSGIDFVV